MKAFGKIESQTWESFRQDGLSDGAKLLAIYLLTCRHGNMAGVFMLPHPYAMGDLEWQRETVAERLKELEANRFITVSKQFDYLCINRFQHFNPPANRNVFVARVGILEALPDMNIDLSVPLGLMSEVAREYKDSASLLNRIETVAKRLGDLRGESKRVREIENKRKDYVQSDNRTTPRTGEVPSSAGSTTGTPESSLATKPALDDMTTDFEQWWVSFPRREGKKGYKQKTFSKYQKLIRKEGYTPEQLLANLQAYGRYCDATKQTGSQYVMTTEPYLNNTDNLTNQWTVNHENRQRPAGQPSAFDQFLAANPDSSFQPEAEPAGGYHPEDDNGFVWDHDRPVRGAMGEGTRGGGSDGSLAGHAEGRRPETAGAGYQTLSAGEGVAAVSTGVSEAVPAEAGRHRVATHGEGVAGSQ